MERISRFGHLNMIWLAFVLAEIAGIPLALRLWRQAGGLYR